MSAPTVIRKVETTCLYYGCDDPPTVLTASVCRAGHVAHLGHCDDCAIDWANHLTSGWATCIDCAHSTSMVEAIRLRRAVSDELD